ncbi:hypothetical protein [Bradyrhizobium retamae]|uniref:hypothetical protein n=1 Tax=Bradyrhizobium retamae TaxID=1300035 RepID=UPI0012E390C8|nr:hypothetical protein [Bradyrhizobium retamae]
MTSEFNDRIAAQRAILRAINYVDWKAEPLLGLSRKAIDRWITSNGIEADSDLAKLVESASSKLFFLANKSQDQISEEYQLVRTEIAATRDAIVRLLFPK